jgi:hypothetical protein
VLGVALVRGLLVGWVAGQLLGHVLAQQLMDGVAAVLSHVDQRVVDQAGQQGQGRPGHDAGRVQGEAATEHRQAGQHAPLVIGKELPGPVDHRPQALMAPLHIGGAGRQQIQATGQPVGDHVRGGRPHPTGGQLDGQRHACDQVTDTGHTLILGGRAEAGSDQAGAILEQPDRRIIAQVPTL